MMGNGWQTATLGKILNRVKEEISLEDDVTYKQVTVRLWNKGVILRGEQQGSEIKTKRQFKVQTGQLVLSRIDVRNGAIGLCPPELDGAIISNDFWAYDFDQRLIYPKFLGLYVKTLNFIDDANRTSSGTTKRIRSDEGAFLQIEIPLPPLDEQRRIVARIEALAARVTAAQSLRREASEEADNLERGLIDQIYRLCAEKYGTFEFEKVCNHITDGDHITPHFADEGVKFIFVGNVSSGFLHFRNCRYVTPEYFATIRPQRKAKIGDILYSAVGATLGIPAIVDQNEDFCFQRHVAIIKPDPSKLDTRFLWYILRSATIFNMAWANTTGSAQPTVPLNAIRKFQIPLPALGEQHRIVAYLDGLQAKVSALRAAQAESERELSALMPSVLDRAFKGEL